MVNTDSKAKLIVTVAEYFTNLHTLTFPRFNKLQLSNQEEHKWIFVNKPRLKKVKTIERVSQQETSQRPLVQKLQTQQALRAIPCLFPWFVFFSRVHDLFVHNVTLHIFTQHMSSYRYTFRDNTHAGGCTSRVTCRDVWNAPLFSRHRRQQNMFR